MNKQNDLDIVSLRHSTAHVLATAIYHLWPNTKFGIGPVIDDGFYYDVDIEDYTISETDFSRIENEMMAIIKSNNSFDQYDLSIEDALSWAKSNNQPYKYELINDLKREGTTVFKNLDKSQIGLFFDGSSAVDGVSFFKNGDFIDLCRGPHLKSTGEIKAFKILKISGAYWRGDQKKSQMQRIYGTSFYTKEELTDYLNYIEEAKKRDHRKLGNDLDLFVFSDLVGSGLPLFTPRGTNIRDQLIKFSNELREKNGFEKVFVPHITKTELYKKSGHWAKFGDELFLVKSQETADELVLKPMNCPHHTRIYAGKQRSYRDLPIRYLETATVYRDEKTGELGGLNRVRSITQDDSHIFCRTDQIESEISSLLYAAQELYNTVDMKLKVRLSYRDESDNYLGDKMIWQNAQDQLKKAVLNTKLDFYEQTGEAAFYGPKIDFMATDVLNREHQVATIQLDFVQPKRFSLEYTDQNGKKAEPVMIHCALLGSIERFLAVYIEHTAGRFPVWNTPEQIRLISLNQQEEILNFINKIKEEAFLMNLRLTIDISPESISKKIRNAEIMKIPYVVVIGNQELNNSLLKPRIRSDLLENDKKEVSLTVENFLKSVKYESDMRTSKTTLV